MEFDRNGYNEKHNCFKSRYYANKFKGDGFIYRQQIEGEFVYRIFHFIEVDHLGSH